MIDSHCHLDHEPIFSDLKNVILKIKRKELKNSNNFNNKK